VLLGGVGITLHHAREHLGQIGPRLDREPPPMREIWRSANRWFLCALRTTCGTLIARLSSSRIELGKPGQRTDERILDLVRREKLVALVDRLLLAAEKLSVPDRDRACEAIVFSNWTCGLP
jgi:hypothetical protein